MSHHRLCMVTLSYIELRATYARACCYIASNKKMDGVWSQLVGRECGRCDTDRLARVGL